VRQHAHPTASCLSCAAVFIPCSIRFGLLLQASITGYNQNNFQNFSLTLASNSVSGMNCTAGYRMLYPAYAGEMYMDAYFDDAACVLYDQVLQVLSNNSVPRLNCTRPSALHGGGASGCGANSAKQEACAPAERGGAVGKSRRLSTSNYSCAWSGNRTF
jgi:hypothetical protein